MALILGQGLGEALLSLFEVIVGKVLVAAKGVRVGDRAVQLYRSVEALDRALVFFLQGEAVPDDTPRVGGVAIQVEGLLS